MRLEALILARDEEHNLKACVESVRGLVDAVTVFDTGSRDGTAALAGDLGVSCVQLPWEDSFAKARNTALDHVRADWVLVLDADERLDRAERLGLRASLQLASAAAPALHLEVRTYTDALDALGYVGCSADDPERGDKSGFVADVQPRLLRCGTGVRYVGRVCERLSDRGGASMPLANRTVGVVHHYRETQSPERREQRRRLRLALALHEVQDGGDAAARGRLGAMLCEQGAWQEGLAHLRAAERAGAGNAALYLRTGVAQLALGLVEGAILSLRQSWAALPGHPEIAAHLARALLRCGRSEARAEAGELLESALEQAPELDMAVLQRAHWHRERHEFGEARALLQTLLDRQPAHALALGELGAVALVEGRLGEAEHCLRRACQQRPGDADPWNNLGCVLERRGRWREAQAAFARAARAAPGQARTLSNLCVAHAACGDLEALCETAAAALASSPEPEETLRVLRERFLEAGWVDALRELEGWAERRLWLERESSITGALSAS